jgi:PAS domain S-box-containing protein
MLQSKKLDILVIDDNKNQKDEISTFLSNHYDVKVILVNSEEKFRKHIQKKTFSIIISETKLKDFSGKKALKIRNKLAPTTPFIIYTTELKTETVISYFKNGVNDYSIKPNLSALKKSISKFLKVKKNKNHQEDYLPLFEEASIAYYRTTPKGKIIFANTTLVKMLGYKSFDELKKVNLSTSAYTDREQRKKFIKKIEKDGFVSNFENEWLDKNGNLIFVSENARAVKDASGKTLYYEGIVKDITEERASQRLLIESENKFREIFNSTNEAIFISDRDSLRLIDCNLSALKMYGYSTKEEILKRSIAQISAGFEPYNTKNAIAKVRYVSKHGPITFEWLARKSNDELFWVEVSLKEIEINREKKILSVVRDISIRKKYEEELKLKTEELEQLFNYNVDLLLIADFESNFIKINNEWERALGYTIDYFKGRKFLEFVHPDDVEATIEEVKKLAQNIPTLKFLNRYRCKDGTYRWLQWKATKFGEYIYASARDISETINYQNALFESEQRFKVLSENSPIGIFQTDQFGSTIYVNQKWCEISGLTFDEALGNGWLRAVHPDDKNIVESNWRKKVLSQSPSESVYRFLHNDGKIVWVQGFAVPQKDDKGRIVGYIGSIVDITEQIKANELLKASEEKFKTLFQSANDAIFIMRNELFIDCNEMTVNIFGCNSKEDIVNHTPYQFSPVFQPDGKKSKEKALELINLALKDKPQRFYWKHKKLNGELFDAEVSLNKITIAGQTYIQAIVRDITEQKKSQDLLIQSEARFRMLADMAPVAIAISDENGNAIYLSKRFTDIFGYNNEDIRNIEDWLELAYPDEKLRNEFKLNWDRTLQETKKGNINLSLEYPVRCKSGQIKIIEFKVATFNELNFITLYDITEKKQSELKLKSRLERIQLLMNLNLNLQEVLDIKEIIKLSYQIIPKYLNVDRVSILLYSPEVNGLISEEYIGKILEKDKVVFQPLTIGISGKCFRECKTVVIDDCLNTDIIEKRFVEQLNLKSCIVIPLKSLGKCFGVLRLDYTKSHHTFSDEEIEFYELLGLQLSAIIKNSQLYTEQKSTAEALKESNERYFLTIDASEQGIWDWKVLTNEVFYSPQWKKQIGYEDYELKNEFETWVEHLHPDDKERCLLAVQNYLKHPSKHFILEFRFRHKDGSYRWIYNKAASILDENGNVVRMFGAHTDITEQKLYQLRLQESEQQFRTLFDKAADAIFIADMDNGIILNVNEAACKLMDLPKERLIGLHQSQLHPPDIKSEVIEKFNDHIRETDNSGLSTPVETEIIRNDGSRVYVEIRSSRILYQGKECIMGMFRDISERKKAEKELIESEKKLRRFFETTIDGICAVDSQERITFVNPRMCEMIGYSHDELINKTIMELLFPEDLPTFIEEKNKRRKGLSSVFELRLRSKSGQEFWALISASPILDDSGKYVGSFGMLTDITDKKATEKKIRSSELRFRSVWENSFDAMRLVDSEGIIVDVNESFCKLFNKKKDEIVGNSFSTLYSDANKNNSLENYRKNFIEGTIPNLFEMKINMWDGTQKWVSITNSFIFNEQGEKLLLSIFRDITKNKLAEEEIRKLYRGIEHSPASVIITDTEGNIEYVNPRFCEITGYSLSEIIGNKPSILKSGLNDQKVYEELWSTITKGKVWKGEFLNKKKNGELYWESAYISPVTNDEGEIINYIGIKEDITDKKKLIEELIHSKEKAEEANRLKSSFLANMSHELRTPLNGILGYSEVLMEDYDDPTIKEQASIIYRSGKRLLTTLNFILDYSKAESEKIETKFESLDIIGLIREVVNLHLPTANKKNIEFKFISDFEHFTMKTDLKLINSIMNNLVNNAIKFTSSGFVKVSVQLSNKNENKFLLIAVEDTGIGISKEYQDVIWEPFRQLSEGKARTYEGTGLGLTIVRKYVDLLNGHIELESEPNKGSKFSIFLPII